MRDNLDAPRIELWNPNALDRIKDALRTAGVAVFAGVADRAEALRLAEPLITIMSHRDSDPDGATTIRHRPNTAQHDGFAGFSDRELRPHTEGSALARPPRVLILICVRPAPAGGHSVLVDGRRLYDDIAHEDRAMLTALSATRAAYFGSGTGYLGSVFEPAPGGRITIRLRLDDLVRFSPVTSRFISGLHHAVERQTRMLRLAAGEGFALLNDRWLHGRTQYAGDRAMLRILGNPLPKAAMPRGFTPTAIPLPAVAV